MKKQIRRCTFETNSSSTHAICITKQDVDKKDIYKNVSFIHGNFGWEYAEYPDVESKASYLYQAILGLYKNKEQLAKLERVKNILTSYGVKCNFEPSSADYYDDGGIDHCENTRDFVSTVLNDEDKFIKYLFGNSFIVTGNDNGYDFSDRMYVFEGEGIDCDYGGLKPEFNNFEIYMKGN